MYYVYVLQSLSYSDQMYVGLTENLNQRLKEHNAGRSTHTSKYTPWQMVVFVGFHNKHKAYDFEKYLKSCAGKAFATKRFW